MFAAAGPAQTRPSLGPNTAAGSRVSVEVDAVKEEADRGGRHGSARFEALAVALESQPI